MAWDCNEMGDDATAPPPGRCCVSERGLESCSSLAHRSFTLASPCRHASVIKMSQQLALPTPDADCKAQVALTADGPVLGVCFVWNESLHLLAA